MSPDDMWKKIQIRLFVLNSHWKFQCNNIIFFFFFYCLHAEGECSNLVSETVPPLKIELNKIPDTVECCGITYRLRGVGCFRRGYSRLRTSIGHYFACCKRGPNQWEVFDDLQRAVKTIDEDTKVPCEFLVYTIWK